MTISYFLATLRRRWVTLLLAVLLGVAASAGLALASPDRYAATTSLVVTPIVSNPMTGSTEEVNIRTEQEILGSPEVARRAGAALGLSEQGAADLHADVDVAAPTGSQILQVTVTADTSAGAVDGANAVAAAYLDLRRDAAVDVTERYLAGVDQQIADLRAQPPTLDAAGMIDRLVEQRSSVTLSEPEAGRIIGSATPPADLSGPGLLATIAGGAMAGLLLGVVVAVLRERTDPSVRSADRLELAAGPLAVITKHRSEEQFWMGLADEAIRHSRVDTDHAPVRVLLHTVPPLPAPVVADLFLDAARWILSDPGAQVAWNEEHEPMPLVPSPATGCVAIVRSGLYRSGLAQAARRSDVAVVVATPRAAMADLTDLVTALREGELEVVVGLTDAALATGRVLHQQDQAQHGPHQAEAEQRIADPATVAG